MSKIYVASSWRNDYYPDVVGQLREAGHEVYDFRNPAPDKAGFHWSEIDHEWQGWSPAKFREGLQHPSALSHYGFDYRAMQWADTFVLVMPCGRSAHLELGWAVGMGKRTCILLESGEPELMYLMVDKLAIGMGEVLDWLALAEIVG